MHVSASEEYGLRCAARLAQAYLDPERNTLSAPEIAEYEGLSVEYVSKFMLHLKKAGLVVAARGVNGGFSLSRAPDQVSLKDVLDALGGRRKNSDEFCDSFAGKSETCVRMDACSIRPMWQILSNYIDEFTRELTLKDLLAGESETLKKSEAIARRNVEQLRAKRLASENEKIT
jgi:Rrf2 family protein